MQDAYERINDMQHKNKLRDAKFKYELSVCLMDACVLLLNSRCLIAGCSVQLCKTRLNPVVHIISSQIKCSYKH